jgi:hypothetical protein
VNWIGAIAAQAFVTLIVASATDLHMTSGQPGSLYSMVGVCKPAR